MTLGNMKLCFLWSIDDRVSLETKVSPNVDKEHFKLSPFVSIDFFHKYCGRSFLLEELLNPIPVGWRQ